MINKFTFPAAVVCAALSAVVPLRAQSPVPDIELTAEWVDVTSLEINSTKRTHGSYTLLITFNSMQNTRNMPTYNTIIRGQTQRVITILPIIKDQYVKCGYSYIFERGYYNPKLDSAFVYRLPFSTTKADAVRAIDLYNMNQRHFNANPVQGWKVVSFMLNAGDTVVAARRGVVVVVEDGHDPLNADMQATYSSNENRVRVEHSDGTIATYSVFEKGSICVAEGDVVYPGSPLGRAGSYYEDGEHLIHFFVSFPKLGVQKGGDTSSKNSSNRSGFSNVYYNPHFATADGVKQMVHADYYRAVSSDEIVQCEMTKKEIKNIANLTIK